MPHRELELVRSAQDGDSRALDVLIRRYQRLAAWIARDYFTYTGEAEDLTQEALIALLAAIRNYDPARGTLKSHAALVIRRRLSTVVRLQSALKHGPLTYSARHIIDDEGSVAPISEWLPSRGDHDPPAALARQEELARLGRGLRSMSEMERRALRGHINGLTYAEIEGGPPGSKPKWVDNAMQRATKKLREAA